MINVLQCTNSTSVISAVQSISCKYLNSCLKRVLQDLRVTSLSVRAYLFTLRNGVVLDEIIYSVSNVVCALQFVSREGSSSLQKGVNCYVLDECSVRVTGV